MVCPCQLKGSGKTKASTCRPGSVLVPDLLAARMLRQLRNPGTSVYTVAEAGLRGSCASKEQVYRAVEELNELADQALDPDQRVFSKRDQTELVRVLRALRRLVP